MASGIFLVHGDATILRQVRVNEFSTGKFEKTDDFNLEMPRGHLGTTIIIVLYRKDIVVKVVVIFFLKMIYYPVKCKGPLSKTSFYFRTNHVLRFFLMKDAMLSA